MESFKVDEKDMFLNKMDVCKSERQSIICETSCNGNLSLGYLRHGNASAVMIANSMFLAFRKSSKKFFRIHSGNNIKQSDTVTGGLEVTTADVMLMGSSQG